MSVLQRAGKDHDPVKPYNWATVSGRSLPVEIISMPTPEDTVMIREINDPTTMREVPLSQVAAFAPDRHELYYEMLADGRIEGEAAENYKQFLAEQNG